MKPASFFNVASSCLLLLSSSSLIAVTSATSIDDVACIKLSNHGVETGMDCHGSSGYDYAMVTTLKGYYTDATQICNDWFGTKPANIYGQNNISEKIQCLITLCSQNPDDKKVCWLGQNVFDYVSINDFGMEYLDGSATQYNLNVDDNYPSTTMFYNNNWWKENYPHGNYPILLRNGQMRTKPPTGKFAPILCHFNGIVNPVYDEA